MSRDKAKSEKRKAKSNNLKLKRESLRKMKNAKERRQFIEGRLGISLENIGHFSLDENVASRRNCENMIGVAQLPMGVAGPIKIQNSRAKVKSYFIPLAITEGALIASVNRGCKAIRLAGGAQVTAHRIGATRGPVFATAGIKESLKLKEWLFDNFELLKSVAEETSSHLQLKKLESRIVGRNVYVRFYFNTADAMGMNMVTIATQKIVELIEQETGVKCLSIAGNFDIDKKPAWMNFINNRGFKAWAEVVLPKKVVEGVLKVAPQDLFETWLAKCMLGSAMSGALGFNAHYANIIAALFIATGQDPAHVVEGSLGITTTNILSNGDLYFSVYLPALMLGTVGGGTRLSTQQEALKLLDVAGGDKGENAQTFAEVVTGAVLAGELSLIASEAEGSLADAHQRLGR